MLNIFNFIPKLTWLIFSEDIIIIFEKKRFELFLHYLKTKEMQHYCHFLSLTSFLKCMAFKKRF